MSRVFRSRPDIWHGRGHKDAEGRRLCCRCGHPVGPRRRDWCGDECVARYLIGRGDQNAARRWLWKAANPLTAKRLDAAIPCALCGVRCGTEHAPHVMWEADHRIPLCEGGDATPENLRALCVPCHRAETKALRRRLADARRARA